jgi:mannitol/fructose-specific phosphotransferase system IIA component (Ntr-type)
MKLIDFMALDATLDEIGEADRNASLRKLVEALTKAGGIKKEDGTSVYQSLKKREDLGSTGIGKGVAVPHAKTDKVKRLTGMLGRSGKGVEFAALDGEPVHIFFLILSPAKPPGPSEHLKALEHISRLLRVDTYVKFLKNAKDKDELNKLLIEEDEGIEY